MKKIVIMVIVFLMVTHLNAQDVKRKLGVGLQASLPTYGISAKYGITDQSVIQGTIAPFSSGLFSVNFYGARYIHRFPDKDQGKVSLDPYIYGGVGLMSFKTNLSDFGMGKSSESFFSYSVGGGLELIVAKKLGLSAELGYGKMNVVDGISVSGILGGGGLHFYIF